MPTKIEKDVISGTDTTGHEWDGIKELNTPLPKWWVYVFYATILFAVVYAILYPSIPGFNGHTAGVLGWSKRAELDGQIAAARARQADFVQRINAATFAVIRSDNDLLNFALTGGRAAFADNCAPCHAAAGAGRPGFPNLADDKWLWGGKIEQIYTTIQHGARNEDADAHVSTMPSFGADQLLKPAEINDVAEFVLSLTARSTDAAAARRGAGIFAQQCASCHGETGKGNAEVGAPNLTDGIWLYGGKKSDIVAQITKPKLGVMPAWGARLDPATLKMLAVYVHSLGGGQ
ncbi:MAG TPA: cytochrome-c oxidase, cbb3-type subunit III [Alphaproteobacteria bacterium]|nr:cytochrome-c oxidase, cbb3-type subunit III [Alphaproteobacteria bacterium]